MYINDGKLNFQNILLSEYIDKSSLISYTNKSLYSPSTKFLCVLDHVVLEKSYTANMLAAYYSKVVIHMISLVNLKYQKKNHMKSISTSLT